MKLSQIRKNPNNPRIIRDEKFEKLKRSIQDFPQMMELRPIVVDENGMILGGNMRYQAIKALKMAEFPDTWVKRADELTEEQKQEFIVKDNIGFGDWDWDAIANEWDDLPLDDWGLDVPGCDVNGEDTTDDAEAKAQPVTLADRFLVPPFSVLDARQGYWQDRKRAWLALGIQSELGRGENALGHPETTGNIDFYAQKRLLEKEIGETLSTEDAKSQMLALGRIGKMASKSNGLLGFSEQSRSHYKTQNGKSPVRCFGHDLMRGEHTLDDNYETNDNKGSETLQNGTSIFDPVLCELVYLWFSGKGFKVLDPFAGGSVRGIVANYLERQYTGVDLRAEQIEANKTQGEKLIKDNTPNWVCGNSLTALPDDRFDLVFSCPPYYDLEVYSDNQNDLSAYKTYANFIKDYNAIIKQSVARLNDNRFACFVVGDIRDTKGIYRNFVSDTIAAFQAAGAMLYNEAILVTSVGSLPIRVGRQFDAGRKLGKTHQNVLVFIKGDAKKATTDCGKVDVIALSELPNSLVGD